MGEFRFETVTALLILLPGFLCARIVQGLCTNRDQSELDKLVQALLYSFLTYVIFAILPVSAPLVLQVQSTGESKYYSIETRATSLVVLAAIAVGLSLLIAVLENNDLLFRPLRWMRITQRTARSSVWNDVFHLLNGYVQVELLDGRNLLGWLRLYSDSPDESSLFLEDASWLDRENNTVKIDGPGIFLTKESGIRTIMFLNAVDKSLRSP